MRHCFLTNCIDLLRENQTPRKRKEAAGARGVIENEFCCRAKLNGMGADLSLVSGASGSRLVIRSALEKLILVLFIA